MRIKSIILTALLGIACTVSAAQAGFNNEGNGTVWDDQTGLMWQQATAGTTATFKWGGGLAGDGACVSGGVADDQEDALCYCENLSLGGDDGWRLPDRNELNSLVDYTKQPVTINTTFFPNTLGGYYWTSTTGAKTDLVGETWVTSYDQAFAIRFDRGFVLGAIPKAGYRYVRCVGDRIFRITSTAVGDGTIVPSDPEENSYGNTVHYTITANPANPDIKVNVVVDGVSLGPVTEYTFPGTTAGAHSITAFFKEPNIFIYMPAIINGADN